MNTQKVLLAGVAFVCAAAGLHAVPTATGFFAELNVGGTYNRLNEQVRRNGQEKDDQVEVVKEHKNAFFVGASVGYGYEMACGFYVGAKVYGLYNNAEIKDEDHIDSTYTNSDGESAPVKYANLEAKPQFSYGAAVMVGGKIVPNLLVYAQCGFEGTYWKIKQRLFMVGDEAVVTIYNTSNETYKYENDKYVFEVKTQGGEEVKRNTFSFVPGIGAKYFFNNGMYVGVDCGVAVGIYRELEDKNFCSDDMQLTTKATNKVEDGDGFDGKYDSVAGKLSVHIGRNIAFRYGLSIGYKF